MKESDVKGILNTNGLFTYAILAKTSINFNKTKLVFIFLISFKVRTEKQTKSVDKANSVDLFDSKYFVFANNLK